MEGPRLPAALGGLLLCCCREGVRARGGQLLGWQGQGGAVHADPTAQLVVSAARQCCPPHLACPPFARSFGVVMWELWTGALGWFPADGGFVRQWLLPSVLASPSLQEGFFLSNVGLEPFAGMNYHALMLRLASPGERLRPPLPGSADWEGEWVRGRRWSLGGALWVVTARWNFYCSRRRPRAARWQFRVWRQLAPAWAGL